MRDKALDCGVLGVRNFCLCSVTYRDTARRAAVQTAPKWVIRNHTLCGQSAAGRGLQRGWNRGVKFGCGIYDRNLRRRELNRVRNFRNLKKLRTEICKNLFAEICKIYAQKFRAEIYWNLPNLKREIYAQNLLNLTPKIQEISAQNFLKFTR